MIASCALSVITGILHVFRCRSTANAPLVYRIELQDDNIQHGLSLHYLNIVLHNVHTNSNYPMLTSSDERIYHDRNALRSSCWRPECSAHVGPVSREAARPKTAERLRTEGYPKSFEAAVCPDSSSNIACPDKSPLHFARVTPKNKPGSSKELPMRCSRPWQNYNTANIVYCGTVTAPLQVRRRLAR